MDFDYFTGGRDSIPTYGDSLGNLMNLRKGQIHALCGKLGTQSEVVTGH